MKRLITLCSVLVFSSVQAGIFDQEWYLQDTATGLYWLDLTESMFVADADVVAHSDPGEAFEGWRYATEGEWVTMLANARIVPGAKDCKHSGIFCHNWSAGSAMAARINGLIDVFGDNYSFYRLGMRSYSGEYILAPDDIRIAQGGYARTDGEGEPDCCYPGLLRDYETYSGVYSSESTQPRSGSGSFWMVRDTIPTIRPSRPEPARIDTIDFEDVMPADLGVQFLCKGAAADGVSKGLCRGHYQYTEDTSTHMWLGVPVSFDRQKTSWLRVVQFDIRLDRATTAPLPAYPECEALDGMYVEGANGRQYIQSSETAPQNYLTVARRGYWCRVTFDSAWEYLPDLQPDAEVPVVIPVVGMGTDRFWTANGITYADNHWNIDNIVVETISGNVQTDFDPWSKNNLIYPDSSYEINIGVSTTSAADGDAFDFDAADIDISTVRAGPAQASLSAAPLHADINSDGDTDYILKFQMDDTGISCSDTSISVTGYTDAGELFVGEDAIVPTNCEDAGCHP